MPEAADVGALAMGSTTYEWIVRHGDQVASEAESPWPYTQPTWVFTRRRLAPIPGADLRFVQGDVRPVHAAMRAAAGGKNHWIVGGGDLAGQFFDAGLLDDLIVQVGSVTLGRGKPLFQKVELYPDRLVVVANLRRTTYARSAFAAASWAKGVPAALEYVGGGYLRLPEVGAAPASVAQTMRAWLEW